MGKAFRKIAFLAAIVQPVAQASAAPAGPRYVKAASIPAPDDRWDFASWDAAHALLLVAHGKDVLLVPRDQPANVRAIGNLAGAHGVAAIPGTTHIAVTSGKDNTLRVLDEASGAEVARIPVGAEPDALILSPSGRTAYVMAAKEGAISIVDLVSNVEKGRISLKSGLEVPVLVTPGLIAVNNEDAGEIEFADLLMRKPLPSILLTGCEGPTGLAYDPSSGVALSACANGKAAIVNLRARKLLGLVEIGQGPDTAIWDAAHKRFLVPCGRSGTLSIIRMNGRKPVIEPSVSTEASARTAALDSSTGRLYLPAARFGPPSGPSNRGPMELGSFHIVVLAPTD